MAYVSFEIKLRVLWTAMAALVLLTRSSAAPILLTRSSTAPVLLTRSSAAPVLGETSKAITYLSQYGYLSPSLRNPSSGHMIDDSSMRRAIAEFQSFVGIKVTGELDEETTKKMSLPRCGVPDKIFRQSRVKRYTLQGSRWRKRHLTYKISKYPSGSPLSHAQVDAELARAFSVWSEHTDLTFTRGSGHVDIEIRFEKGDHGDGDPFDGPSGTLAHAYFPDSGGDAHFDDAERWTMNSYRGINLFQVAAHEFGHSLGLDHSSYESALMAPLYRRYEPSFRLHQDDIQGIQKLYSQNTQERSNDGNGWLFGKGWHLGDGWRFGGNNNGWNWKKFTNPFYF